MSLLSELMLAAAKTALDDGRLYFFSGPVPASSDDALDMGSDHTQLVMFTENNDGSTGLTFAAPSGNTMLRNAGETWLGLIAFDGAEDSETTLPATFYRFCASGDNGRGAAAAPRVQGTIGPPGSDLPMPSNLLTDNGTNTQGIDYFAVVEDQV